MELRWRKLTNEEYENRYRDPSVTVTAMRKFRDPHPCVLEYRDELGYWQEVSTANIKGD